MTDKELAKKLRDIATKETYVRGALLRLATEFEAEGRE